MLVHTITYMRDSFFEGARMQHHHVDTAQGDFGGSLYTCFAATIFTYLSQQVPNEQDAEDLLLEVYLAALKNDSLSTMSAPSQLAWLRRVARNKAIARLPALQRELLRLRYRNGLRFHEIAALLERPEGTVRKLFVRTLHQLREIFDQLEGESNDATIR